MNRIVGRIETLTRDVLERDVHRNGPGTGRYVDLEGRPTEYVIELAVGAVYAQSDFFELCDLVTPIGVACGRRRSTEVFHEDGMNPIELRRKFRNRAVSAYCDPRAVEDLTARWHIAYTKMCHLAVMVLEAASRHDATEIMEISYARLIHDEKVTRPEEYDAFYGFREERERQRHLLRNIPAYDIYPDGCSTGDGQG